MAVYSFQEMIRCRKEMAMKACGIFDEEEVGRIDPISYAEKSGDHFFVTVWMFGNKKIYSAMMEILPGNWPDPESGYGRAFFDVYRFKNINDIRVDDYGCVITLNTGKKLELNSNCLEGKDAFAFSAHGLVSLWDEYDD
ncbi:hypothetical protein EMO92_10200 [Bifidobacterium reuteri]|nr:MULTISPECIES: hypothetical protein [Bifidobacterium]KAA8823323.1 hypothetical protein EMO92_10200 [Bifidobacterium reuteri]TPF78231.1 hypothetical protein BW09_05260 [Bifidobacterium sp. UTCIF-1]TPF79966.1 hypothetical protein BW08_06935 [Bifidobacterium sp. UTCIF-24]TPF82405.1 hypothetical protein BW12_04655 [Bifidobacterium sp. UTCIF-3]TPF83677.1 hypothetical protein BW07_09110 [Bifidobacterium sp. UTCIF-36]